MMQALITELNEWIASTRRRLTGKLLSGAYRPLLFGFSRGRLVASGVCAAGFLERAQAAGADTVHSVVYSQTENLIEISITTADATLTARLVPILDADARIRDLEPIAVH